MPVGEVAVELLQVVERRSGGRHDVASRVEPERLLEPVVLPGGGHELPDAGGADLRVGVDVERGLDQRQARERDRQPLGREDRLHARQVLARDLHRALGLFLEPALRAERADRLLVAQRVGAVGEQVVDLALGRRQLLGLVAQRVRALEVQVDTLLDGLLGVELQAARAGRAEPRDVVAEIEHRVDLADVALRVDHALVFGQLAERLGPERDFRREQRRAREQRVVRGGGGVGGLEGDGRVDRQGVDRGLGGCGSGRSHQAENHRKSSSANHVERPLNLSSDATRGA